MKTNKEQTKLGHVIELFTKCPEFQYSEDIKIEGWNLYLAQDEDWLCIDGINMEKHIPYDEKAYLSILNNLIADLERHLKAEKKVDGLFFFKLYKHNASKGLPANNDEWQHIFTGSVDSESIFNFDNDTFKIKLVEVGGGDE